MLDLGITKVCSVGPPATKLVGTDGINLGEKLQVSQYTIYKISSRIRFTITCTITGAFMQVNNQEL